MIITRVPLPDVRPSELVEQVKANIAAKRVIEHLRRQKVLA